MSQAGLACSRLRDSGEKGEEKTRAKKRAGAGENRLSGIRAKAWG